ncbi:MAG: sulfotransferase [Candidatus Thiodiazotropha sp.]
MSVIPNLFIVGAPKCGTTALATYLDNHPQVSISKPKEPLFFATDLNHKWRTDSKEDYKKCFVNHMNEKIVGEGTVWYLMSKNAAKEIFEYNPKSKIIIMLRNPIDMMYSLHSQFLLTCNENIASFYDALCAQEHRKRGLSLPANSHFIAGLQYYEVADYAVQIKRYLKVFPREQIKFIIFEEFIKDTDKIYKDILRYLNLNDTVSIKYEKVNVSKIVVYPAINQFINKPPTWARKLKQTIGIVGPRLDYIKKMMLKVSVKNGKRMQLSKEMRKKISEKYDLELKIRETEILTNMDLSLWNIKQI